MTEDLIEVCVNTYIPKVETFAFVTPVFDYAFSDDISPSDEATGLELYAVYSWHHDRQAWSRLGVFDDPYEAIQLAEKADEEMRARFDVYPHVRGERFRHPVAVYEENLSAFKAQRQGVYAEQQSAKQEAERAEVRKRWVSRCKATGKYAVSRGKYISYTGDLADAKIYRYRNGGYHNPDKYEWVEVKVKVTLVE